MLGRGGENLLACLGGGDPICHSGRLDRVEEEKLAWVELKFISILSRPGNDNYKE